jgi:di/tricarboxylate transporter
VLNESTIVFLIIGIAAMLMASNRVRFDVVALMVMMALIVSGILSVPEALSGFGNTAVVVVGGLFVVGEMLDRTGVARAVGDVILKRGGKSELQLLVLIMVSAGLLGSAMSSTAVVAIFIPVVLRIAAQTGVAATRILIPMSYAALISGMTTLIASPPNLVVSAELVSNGYRALGFFSFSLIGLAVLAVAVFYVVVFGRQMLPDDRTEDATTRRRRTIEELWWQYDLDKYADAVEITAESPLAGQQLGATGLGTRYGTRVLVRVRRAGRDKEAISLPTSTMELEPGDVLVLIAAERAQVQHLMDEQKLRKFAAFEQQTQRWAWEIGMASVLIHPDSALIGRSLTETRFRTRYGLQAIGARQGATPIRNVETHKLAAGDSLMLHGPWSRIDALSNENHEFVLTDVPAEREDIVEAFRKAPTALLILGAMVLLSVLDVAPLVVCVLGAAMAAVVTGCLSAEQAYRSVRWNSLVLVAGMLPLADALQATGGSDLIVRALLDAFGKAGPNAMFTVLFFLTAALGLVLSNTASAVLVVPIAITAAQALEVSPYPFAIAVLIAASAAYSTPVSTPVVTLVVEPGRYRFMDFVKVGTPLLVLTWLVALFVTPLVFPYQPG